MMISTCHLILLFPKQAPSADDITGGKRIRFNSCENMIYMLSGRVVDVGQNSSTSARHEDDLGYMRIWTTSPRRL